jgi:YbbR domain-containing protein
MKQNLPSILISVLLAFGAWSFITLSGDFYLNSRIPVVYSNLAPNLIVDNSLPKEVVVKLKGSGWKFISLYFNPDKKFFIPVTQDSINSGLYLINLMNENAWLTSDFTVVDIHPTYLKIKTSEVEFAQKNVVPDLVMNFAEGFGLGSKVKVSPEMIRIKGVAEILQKIKNLKTVKTVLNGLKEKVIMEVMIEPIKGVDMYPNKIMLELDIQKIADREVEGVKIIVPDNPEGKEVLLTPEEVTVVIRGGIDRIGLVKADEIKVLLSYAELLKDSSGLATPNVVLPDNLSFIDVKPNKIKYIIKQ